MSSSTPAPKRDQIKGSDRNKSGSASSGSGKITVDASTRLALQRKVDAHNKDNPEAAKSTTLGTLLAVYRRGAGAFSTSHRPGVSRGAWAMARVNAFLRLLRVGSPENSKYVTDNDLLPAKHPRKSKTKEWAGLVEFKIEEEEKYTIPAGAKSAAKRALAWIADGKAGKGFTDVGRARAAQLARGGSVSRDVAIKMRAYFARHEVDKKADGFRANSDKYPSPGRVAWDAWGGDAGRSWVNRLSLDD
jgi:hypothetical protein